MTNRTQSTPWWVWVLAILGAFYVHNECVAGGWTDKSRLVRAFHFTHSGETMAMLTVPGQPRMVVFFDRAVSGTYQAEVGTGPNAPYNFTVHGSPVRIYDGTYPNGIGGTMGYAWRFNGTDAYLSLADNAGGEDFDPAGDFSVIAVITPLTVSGERCVIAKFQTTGNQRSWKLCQVNDTVVLTLSANGSATTTVTRTGALAPGRMSLITATYNKATTTGTIYVDNLSAVSNASMSTSIYNGTAAVEIGSSDSGTTLFSGWLDFAVYYDGIVITQARHNRMHAMFRGMIDSAALNVVTTSSATPPAIILAPPDSGVQPFLMRLPDNTNMVGSPATGSGGIYGASEVTNLVPYAVFETWAAGAPTGWTESITGSGNCDQTTTHMAVGASAAQCSTAGTGDAVSLTSSCMTVTGSTLYEASVWAKTTSGTGRVTVTLREYSDTGCSSLVTSTNIVANHNPGSSWTRLGGTQAIDGRVTTQASTIRAQLVLSLPTGGAAQTTIFDAAMLRAVGNFPKTDAFCGANAAGSATCSVIVNSTSSPLSANGAQTIEIVGRGPAAGTEYPASPYLLADGGVSGANKVVLYIGSTTDEPVVGVMDASGTGLFIAPDISNWGANTDYILRAYMDGNGQLGLTWPPGTWQESESGSGAGNRSGGQSTLYFSSASSAGYDFWLRSFRLYRGVLR